MRMLTISTERSWLIRWMYASAIAHLLAGLALPWISGVAPLDGYHATLAGAFWPAAMASAAHAQQAWWLALFGPTMQAVGLWMLALTWFGDRRGEPAAWLWFGAGLLLWGPQDMLVSLRAGIWPHVWIDIAAMALLLPPAWRLYQLDSRRAHAAALKAAA